MPTYEYRCPAGHVFEKFYRKITDKRRLPCPTCGKLAQRLISGGVGVVFKGPGFYATDYKQSGEKQEKTEKERTEKERTEKEKPAESSTKPKQDSSSDK